MRNSILTLGVCFAAAVFLPQKLNSAEHKYRLEIFTAQCKMQLYLLERDGRISLVRNYEIASAMPGVVRPLGKGVITSIEFDPWWHPTKHTRRYFLRKKRIYLPVKIPPGDKLNYMGAFKICLSHRTCNGSIYRIHGNNDPAKIGKRVTGGCIRMHNCEGVALACVLKVGTEVIIYK